MRKLQGPVKTKALGVVEFGNIAVNVSCRNIVLLSGKHLERLVSPAASNMAIDGSVFKIVDPVRRIPNG